MDGLLRLLKFLSLRPLCESLEDLNLFSLDKPTITAFSDLNLHIERRRRASRKIKSTKSGLYWCPEILLRNGKFYQILNDQSSVVGTLLVFWSDSNCEAKTAMFFSCEGFTGSVNISPDCKSKSCSTQNFTIEKGCFITWCFNMPGHNICCSFN